MSRAVALFSGGLDSMLSVRILQQQGFDVEVLNIRTIYSCCQATAAESAVRLGVRLTVLPVRDDYLEVIRNPLYGYGKGANPCIDCRVYMCRMAGELMRQVGADVVITGEVVGQRPMSQKREQLEIIARRSGLEDRLLRPLSAKLLKPTAVERRGLVDRQRLYKFNGRSRRLLLQLAETLGVEPPASPSTGCALTEPLFAARVFDLIRFDRGAVRWDFELLSHGRHFRFNEQTKVVLGRSARDNATLGTFAARHDAPEAALLAPDDFRGPAALVVGRVSEGALGFAGALMLRYARPAAGGRVRVRVAQGGKQRVIAVDVNEAAQAAEMLR